MYILIVTVLILLFGLYAYSALVALAKRRYIRYLFCSHKLSDFSYGDIVDSHNVILRSWGEAMFIKEENGKFIYYVPFQLQTYSFDSDEKKTIRMSDIKQDLHCKIFCIAGFPEPIVGTSEMIIPLDSLKKVVDGEKTVIN